MFGRLSNPNDRETKETKETKQDSSAQKIERLERIQRTLNSCLNRLSRWYANKWDIANDTLVTGIVSYSGFISYKAYTIWEQVKNAYSDASTELTKMVYSIYEEEENCDQLAKPSYDMRECQYTTSNLSEDFMAFCKPMLDVICYLNKEKESSHNEMLMYLIGFIVFGCMAHFYLKERNRVYQSTSSLTQDDVRFLRQELPPFDLTNVSAVSRAITQRLRELRATTLNEVELRDLSSSSILSSQSFTTSLLSEAEKREDDDADVENPIQRSPSYSSK